MPSSGSILLQSQTTQAVAGENTKRNSPITDYDVDAARTAIESYRSELASDENRNVMLQDPASRSDHRGPSEMAAPLEGPMSPYSINGEGPTILFDHVNRLEKPQTPATPVPSYLRHNHTPVNPADQNPPCNTLYVGNLPYDTSEEELKAMFSKQRGYKRLCFRVEQDGPVCFVEFKDIAFATQALHDLYGQLLHSSVEGGIRLSFSKNSLGVGSGPKQGSAPSVDGISNGVLATILSSALAKVNDLPPELPDPADLGRTDHWSETGREFTTPKDKFGPKTRFEDMMDTLNRSSQQKLEMEFQEARNNEENAERSMWHDATASKKKKPAETVSKLPGTNVPATESDVGIVPIAATTTAPETIHESLTHICGNIHHRLQPEVDSERFRVMTGNIEELIKAFAIQLGFDGSLDMGPSVMCFVYRYHNEICALLNAKFMDEDSNATATRQNRSGDMTLAERMEMWYHVLSRASSPFPDDLPVEFGQYCDFKNNDLISASKLSKFCEVILKSSAYSWLISTLKTRALLSYGDGHVIMVSDEIQQKVLGQLQTDFSFGNHRPQKVTVCFVLSRHWDILQTGFNSNGSNNGDTRLRNIAVLNVSSATEAQIATAEQYMHQVWPDSGPLLLQGFQNLVDGNAVKNGDHPYVRVQLHDTTHVEIYRRGSDVDVVCCGPAYLAAQCAVQLSWIVCAVMSGRSPPVVQTPSLTRNSPFYSFIYSLNETAKRQHVLSHLERAKQLWQGFDAPVCVWGFPTARRPEGFRGVELPLCLAQISQSLSPRLIFEPPRKRLILSTSATSFCCAGKIDSSWLWHLGTFCTCSTEWMESSNTDLGDLDFNDIAHDQHIFGHCEDPREQESNPESVELIVKAVADNDMMGSLDHSSSAAYSAQSGSVDADLMSISDFSCDMEDDTPQLDNLLTDVIDSVALQLFSRTACRGTPALEHAPCDEDSTSNAQCTAGGSAQILQSQSENSARNAGKRKAGDRDEGDDGGDSSQNRRPKKRIITVKASVPQQTFACTFWKLDPNKHRACFHAKLLTSSRVKQHLSRSHTPRFYCQLCFAVFREESAQEQHVIQRSCTRVPGMILDGITPDQQLQLSRKPKLTLTEEERWYRIWDIVLPNCPRPESPYIDSQLSDCCARFREHWQNMGPEMLLAEIQSSGVISTFTLDDAARARTLRMILARGLDMIWESWTLSSTTQQPARVQLPDTPTYTQEHGSARPGSSTPSSSSAVNVTPEAQGDLRATPWLSTQRQENSVMPTSSTADTYQGAESMFSDASASGAIQSLEPRAESYDTFDMFDDSAIFTSGQNLEADAGDNGNWVDVGL